MFACGKHDMLLRNMLLVGSFGTAEIRRSEILYMLN